GCVWWIGCYGDLYVGLGMGLIGQFGRMGPVSPNSALAKPDFRGCAMCFVFIRVLFRTDDVIRT
ncbi:hypothetical protein, partial [Tritonibacter mobilis]|uniref:hypothetical protein n=1 Tax=Tritonibacter mobilis TaxID=379347 RepID=UPI0019551871